MAVTVEKFKLYMRIDGEIEDELLQQLLETARAYLIGAVSDFETNYSNDTEFAKKADLLQMIIAAEYYQNRDNTARGVSYSYSGLMVQLQNWVGEVSTYTTAASLGSDEPP